MRAAGLIYKYENKRKDLNDAFARFNSNRIYRNNTTRLNNTIRHTLFNERMDMKRLNDNEKIYNDNFESRELKRKKVELANQKLQEELDFRKGTKDAYKYFNEHTQGLDPSKEEDRKKASAIKQESIDKFGYDPFQVKSLKSSNNPFFNKKVSSISKVSDLNKNVRKTATFNIEDNIKRNVSDIYHSKMDNRRKAFNVLGLSDDADVSDNELISELKKLPAEKIKDIDFNSLGVDLNNLPKELVGKFSSPENFGNLKDNNGRTLINAGKNVDVISATGNKYTPLKISNGRVVKVDDSPANQQLVDVYNKYNTAYNKQLDNAYNLLDKSTQTYLKQQVGKEGAKQIKEILTHNKFDNLSSLEKQRVIDAFQTADLLRSKVNKYAGLMGKYDTLGDANTAIFIKKTVESLREADGNSRRQKNVKKLTEAKKIKKRTDAVEKFMYGDYGFGGDNFKMGDRSNGIFKDLAEAGAKDKGFYKEFRSMLEKNQDDPSAIKSAINNKFMPKLYSEVFPKLKRNKQNKIMNKVFKSIEDTYSDNSIDSEKIRGDIIKQLGDTYISLINNSTYSDKEKRKYFEKFARFYRDTYFARRASKQGRLIEAPLNLFYRIVNPNYRHNDDKEFRSFALAKQVYNKGINLGL